jgi:aspartyl-tRNA(Asn)/glutamyl-tRNA(Gln) amidotransferase subunit B
VRPAALASLIKCVQAGEFNTSKAREVFAVMIEKQIPAADAIAQLGIAKVDDSELIELCKKLVADNPKIVADVKAGKLQAAGGFVGQAKKLNPNVNPGRVRELCIEMIEKM